MISEKLYIADGTSKIFGSDFNIVTEDYVRVFVDAQIQAVTSYDLINNSIVFDTAPTASSEIRIQVATQPDELQTNPTDVFIVASNVDDVNTVATDITNVNTVATNVTDVNSVATNMAEVLQADTNAATATTQANIATTKATEASNSATAAQTALDTFTGQYHGASSTNPTTGVDTGDLYFDTTDNKMRVYDGGSWIATGSATNGTSQRQSFTATAGQTTFTVAGGYDANFADVYLNGVKLVNGADVNVTSGTDVVLTAGATEGDTVDVVAYGSFELANTYVQEVANIKKASISSLLSADTATHSLVTVVDYHDNVEGGGGTFYWDSTADKAAHNGGTIIDPSVAFPSDWNNQTQVEAWFTAGTGTGCWVRKYDGVVNVKWFGAKGDGTTDDTLAIQSGIDSIEGIQPLGGGTILFPAGVYRTNRVINVHTNSRIVGESFTTTYIKPLDSATFTANQAVVQSKYFDSTQGINLWDYYEPYPQGLTMGVSLSNIAIDGNKANVAAACGLNIYGGKWTLQNVAVINTASHAIWTESGVPGSSTSGDDLHDFLNMHECYAENVYISNAKEHGWLYRGANDSSINNIQIKTCGWAGFFQESTGNNSVGNLEISSLHAYSCACGHDANGAMIELSNANAGFIYVDASLKNGLRTYGAATIIGEVLVLKNNASNAGSYWGIICDVATQISLIRNTEPTARTSGTNSGLLQVNAASTLIGQVRTVQASGTTISEKAVEVNAQCTIESLTIESYDSVGSVGLDISAQRTIATVQAKNCVNAVDYNLAGRNKLILNAEACTSDITYNAATADSDDITLLSSNKQRVEQNVGKLLTSALNFDISTVASTASYTPNLDNISYIKITGLASNITFNAPVNQSEGDVLDIYLQQDSTGGRTVTWDSAYKTGYVGTGNAAFTRHHITFVYDGSFWIERSRTGWF
jgi:hypothetical protein